MPNLQEVPYEPTFAEALGVEFDPTIVKVVEGVLPMCRQKTIDEALSSIQLAIRPTGVDFRSDDEQRLRHLLTKHAAELSLRFGQ